jgi:subfamily B ATP-binding cassette protein MsbA
MQNMMERMFGPALSAVIQILALSVFLLFLNWKLALLALVLFPVAVWPIRSFGRRLRGLSRQVQDAAAALSAHVEENLTQAKLVRAYQGEGREVERWRAKLAEQLKVALGGLRVRARSTPIMEAIGALGFAGLVFYSGYEILYRGTMTGGSLVMFLGGVLKLYPNIKSLNGLWSNIQVGMGAAERVFPLLDEKPEILEAADARKFAGFRREIEYDRVSFAYRRGEPVLQEIRLKVLRGQRVAFVGPSGAGKTTLLDLLLRFFDPDSGRVLLDGEDIRSMTLESLRRQVALVSQEVLLFNTSARENLLYARPSAAEEEMVAAARAAGADEFLATLPDGYDTAIGAHGGMLSGGERQRLSIARAFLKDSPILILDEATAALDAASEAKVQGALESLMANRTVLIIAHRLATVRRADRIYVIEDGRIIDEGTHEHLLGRGGLYRNLYDLQFKDIPQKS